LKLTFFVRQAKKASEFSAIFLTLRYARLFGLSHTPLPTCVLSLLTTNHEGQEPNDMMIDGTEDDVNRDKEKGDDPSDDKDLSKKPPQNSASGTMDSYTMTFRDGHSK
jgi:hypothetical protein